MGLFDSIKKDSPEKKQALEQNYQQLKEFEVTKAWGVKKYPSSMQFIYDKKHQWFVVVEGPEENFREKNPWIISFDQVKDCYLDVDEYYTMDGGEYTHRESKKILQKDYEKVFWRYDFYINIDTTHPYAKNIYFKTNYKPTVVKVKQRGIFYRKGLEMRGEYKGDEITELVDKLKTSLGLDKEKMENDHIVGMFTGDRPDTIGGLLMQDYMEDRYVKRVEVAIGNIERADRIRKLLKK